MDNNNNNVGWIEVIGGVALGFLTGMLIDNYESKETKVKENIKYSPQEVEDLGYAVIVEDEKDY